MRHEKTTPAFGCGTQILVGVCLVLLILLIGEILDGHPYGGEILRWTSI